jgi:hypothetical protein
MKRPLGVLLLFSTWLVFSSIASAAGINLSWDACVSEGGVQAKIFACNTNSGNNVMVGSFVLAADQPHFIGVEVLLDFQAQSDSLPSWWQFLYAGACRSSGISVNFLFGSDPNVYCTDPWGGQAIGGLAGYQTYSTPHEFDINPNTSRLKLGAAVPSTSPIQLTAGTEYYCFKLVLNASKTVGTGSCDGCSVPMCIVLSKISVVQNDGTQEDLTSAITSNILSWQSGISCSGANVPHNVTWGQIRSVLR